MGGRVAFNASSEQAELAGVVDFYGVTRRRDDADRDAPIDKVGRMRAPHSFFDRSFAEWTEACDDSWRRVLGFIASGDPVAVR